MYMYPCAWLPLPGALPWRQTRLYSLQFFAAAAKVEALIGFVAGPPFLTATAAEIDNERCVGGGIQRES